ncbi:MAG: hypothetical protein ISS44_04365 [Candidatus Omnitrophica bacterium]|nr:hypothetical protein [Candidatus Omnitrophota bacterium]
MTNTSKLFIAIGCLLILAGIALRVSLLPIVITGRTIRPISLVILANTSFLLAILFKR